MVTRLARALTAFFWVMSSSAFADNSDLAKAFKIVDQIKLANRNVFGSLHCKYQSNKGDGIVQTELTHFEFWSRENRYFRIDMNIASPTGVQWQNYSTKLIVRPEGFVVLRENTTGSFAVVSFGALKDGLDSLSDYLFFRNGEMLGSGPFLEVLLKDAGSDLKTKKWHLNGITQETSDKVVLDFGIGTFTYAVSISKTIPAVIGFTATSEKGETVWNCIRTFHSSLPIVELQTEERINQGVKLVTNLSLDEIDQNEVPMDIFSFDAQGLGGLATSSANTWIRRLVIFSIGLFLVGMYALFRSQKFGKKT